MISIEENVSLRPFNTFGIEATARHYVAVQSIDALREAVLLPGFSKKFILGGGSNILITQPIEALVIHLDIKGKKILWEDERSVTLKVMAGELWHPFVIWAIDQGYGGIENLSLIPGQVGTAPIQNIGAYGVELKDVFVSCEAMELASGKMRTFSKEECQFGYRDSFFKRDGRGKYVITSVILTLTKKDHSIHTEYGAIRDELKKQSITDPGIREVSEAVIAIRSSKLPDPAELGNSGSFFKNPVISFDAYGQLLKKHADIPGYELANGDMKVPAGWLIENCGFKGMREGDAGVYDKQALVLVNHGNASGLALLALSQKIQAAVLKKFGIQIHPEVNIIS